MSERVWSNAVLAGLSGASIVSRAISMVGGNAVRVTSESTAITADTRISVDGSNDGQNWAALGSIGNVGSTSPFVGGSLTGLSFAFVRVRGTLQANGTAILTADVEVDAL